MYSNLDVSAWCLATAGGVNLSEDEPVVETLCTLDLIRPARVPACCGMQAQAGHLRGLQDESSPVSGSLRVHSLVESSLNR